MSRTTQTIQTPQGSLVLVRQTAEKLLREGIISGTMDGELHAGDAATVKAAIMASAVCDFCSVPGAVHYFDVPDFGLTTDPRGGTNYSQMVGTSTGGWMACDTCDTLIRAGRRQQLVDRAISTHAFPKFTRAAVEEMYAKFWQGMDDRNAALGIGKAVGDFIEDRLTGNYVVKPEFSARDKRVEAMKRVTGLTVAQAEALTRGELDRDSVAKLVAWRRGFGGTLDPRAIADLLGGAGPKKPLADVTPHWQVALDMRFNALQNVQRALNADGRAEYFEQTVDLNDTAAVLRMTKLAAQRSSIRDLGFGVDARMLRAAAAYSFNGETIAAIREAAQGVPHDAPLSSIETPNTGAGWFWFAEPLPVTASPIAADKVHALLWGWTNSTRKRYEMTVTQDMLDALGPEKAARLEALGASYSRAEGLPQSALAELTDILRDSEVMTRDAFEHCVQEVKVEEPSLMFSAYVIDEKRKVFSKGGCCPSTKWYWPLHLSFTDMLEYNRQSWQETYGPGGLHEGDSFVVGSDETLRAVAELSLFFVMACLWFKQTVPMLTREQGPVERHAKKRYVREHKLQEPPSVQVVALRKSLRVPAEKAEGAQAATVREYQCRWIVKGHPRLQACGPGRKDKKLIWIEAHPAGPADKPLRTRERVYAVIR